MWPPGSGTNPGSQRGQALVCLLPLTKALCSTAQASPLGPQEGAQSGPHQRGLGPQRWLTKISLGKEQDGLYWDNHSADRAFCSARPGPCSRASSEVGFTEPPLYKWETDTERQVAPVHTASKNDTGQCRNSNPERDPPQGLHLSQCSLANPKHGASAHSQGPVMQSGVPQTESTAH